MKALARAILTGVRSLFDADPAVRLRGRRILALEVLKRVRTELTFQRQGFLWAGASASSITQAIYVDEHYQDAHMGPMVEWLKANTAFSRPVIVNVGANLGDVVLPLTRTGKRIVAVEPNPETFARLERNVRQNGLSDRVICCNVAIAASAGTAELVTASDAGNSEINEPGGRLGFDGVDQRAGVVSVKTVRLDDLLASLGITPAQVALVWSDTQGFESQVIESATALWKNGVPLWVEIWPKGLICHGGVPRFLELCRQNFRSLFPETRFDGKPEPITALEPIVAGLKGAEFTDVLLIP